MTTREELLDQYINDLNDGNRSRPASNDPELAELFQTAEAVSRLRQPDWPPEAFAGKLAANLSARLKPQHNGRAINPGKYPEIEMAASNPWTGPVEAEPEQPGRLRRTIQVAGALAAFAIFALVLIVAFREVNDDGPSFGAAPPVEPPIGQLAFSASYAGNADIYLINADGTGQIQLTDDPAADTWPAWSPDGTRIAFVSDRSGTEQIWVMDADGSNVHRVTDNPGVFQLPRWSPDGTQIAALGTQEEAGSEATPELYVFSLDGSNARSLTAGHGIATAFAWSPDGKQIAVGIGLSGRGDRTLIYDVDGTESRGLNDSEAFQYWPVWSPNGSQIAVAEATQLGPDTATFSIVISDVDGDGTLPISSHLGFASIHDWSPDGQYISVSSSNSAGNAGIFIVPLDNPEAYRFLTGTNRSDVFAQWSPDSQQLAFFRETEQQGAFSTMALMVIDVDSNDLIEVASGIDLLSIPAWRPVPQTDLDEESQHMEAIPTTSPVTDEAVPIGSPTPAPTAPETNFPPALLVASDIDSIEAFRGSFSHIDLEREFISQATSPFMDVGEIGMAVQPGSMLNIQIDDSAGQPERITASIYTWLENNAIPVSDDGTPGTRPWFTPGTEPIAVIELDINDPQFTMLDDPGDYVVRLDVEWPSVEYPDGLHPVYAHYAVRVQVGEIAQPVSTPAQDDSIDPDQVGVDDAVAIARQILGDDGDLRFEQDAGGMIQVHRNTDDPGTSDLILIDPRSGQVLLANIGSHTTKHSPRLPVSEDEAVRIAEQFASDWVPEFLSMTLIDLKADSGTPGANNENDRLLTITWAVLDEASGARLPMLASVVVNLETGLVWKFQQYVEPYEGPTTPVVTKEQAETIAQSHARQESEGDHDFVVQKVDLVALSEWYPVDGNLVWWVELQGHPSVVMIDAMSGAVLLFDELD